MPHYVSLMRWTSQGVAGLPAWRDRVEEGERIISDAGGSLVGVYVTLGRYDVVEIFEAPDDETAAEIILKLQRHGAEHTETLRAFTRDEAERLHRRGREPPLARALEQASAGFGSVARGTEGPAAGDLLEHDSAPALAVALAEQPQCRLDPLRVVVRRHSQIVDRQRLRGDDEQRLDDAREAVDRIGADQAERAIHCEPSPSFAVTERIPRTRMSANEDACSSETSPALRSSSIARKATAASTRESPTTSDSKSNRRRRRNTARNRSRNCDTGGKRSAMCPSESEGGSVARSRSAAPSRSGSCGASWRSTRGAKGAGPSRKKRSDSASSRSESQAAASFIRR